MSKQHLSLVIALAFLASLAAADDGFTAGRATFYTDNQQGSCHYGTDVGDWYAAWPDGQTGAPNCGSCFEVACVDKDFTDGYGESVQRSGACYDSTKTVKVKIVDSCPCVHANFYSNQRWCCQDMQHIDLADKVFAELADPKWGVIGAKWRKVSCNNLGPGSLNDGSGSDTSADSQDNTSPSPAPSHAPSSPKKSSSSWPSWWSSEPSWARNWHWGSPRQWSDGASDGNSGNSGNTNNDSGSDNSGLNDNGNNNSNNNSNNNNNNNNNNSGTHDNGSGSSDSNRYQKFGDFLAKAWMGGS